MAETDSGELPARHFDHPLTVEPGDIDANAHANNVVYLRWVQEAAVAHWFAAVEPDLASSIAWAVVRHEIDYKRPALLGDSLIARTWVGEVTAATCERFCEVLRPIDGQTLARVRTLWCVFDSASGRPRRIDPRVRAAFEAG
jgi:acyl-CoA thioester hydrolase